MRVLAVHPFITGERINPFAGGKDKEAFQLTSWLVKRGNEVAILPWKERLGQDCLFQLEEATTARVLTSLAILRLRDLARLPRYVRSMQSIRRGPVSWMTKLESGTVLQRALNEFKPDIIHVHYTKSTVPDIYCSLGKPVPIILTHTHGIGNTLDAYDLIVFPSAFQRSILCDRGLVPPDKTRVIYNPVDEVFLQGNNPFQRDVIAFVGVLTGRKGLDILLSAYRLDPELNKLGLHVCGDGPLRGTYEAFTREHNLNVTFHGRASTAAVREILMHAILTVAPSREESFGIVYAESLCCGTPFIGYSPTVQELEELWGMRVGFAYDASSNDAQALARLIHKALPDEILSQPSREALMKKAKECFTIERYGTEYLACYAEVISRKRAL